jgi:histidyl-tRNA synthetase
VHVIEAVKGMNDVLPRSSETFLDSAVWDRVVGTAADVLASYGYRQVVFPVVESTSLFARGIGEDTDIVSKEMYSFTDRGGEALTLRPEGTAGAVRAYIEHNYGKTSSVQRWWYLGPMFRAEKPQKGRYRQFYQVGAELFGAGAPAADAEQVIMLTRLCVALRLTGINVRVNSLGDPDSRVAYRTVLKDYLATQPGALCESCQRRATSNPLRVLDCKRPQCRAVAQKAPDIFGSFTGPARAHFAEVRALLDSAGVPFVRDPRLVRGLDYYTGTIFEFTSGALGAQDAILGGGRYDNLVAELGGPPTPAIGFAAGVERLALVVAQQLGNEGVGALGGPHLYVVPMGGAESNALALAEQVRTSGRFRVEVDVTGKGLKQQMKRADRSGARFALVLGEDELASGRGRLKDLRTGLQQADASAMVELSGPALVRALEAAVPADPRGAKP